MFAIHGPKARSRRSRWLQPVDGHEVRRVSFDPHLPDGNVRGSDDGLRFDILAC